MNHTSPHLSSIDPKNNQGSNLALNNPSDFNEIVADFVELQEMMYSNKVQDFFKFIASPQIFKSLPANIFLRMQEVVQPWIIGADFIGKTLLDQKDFQFLHGNEIMTIPNSSLSPTQLKIGRGISVFIKNLQDFLSIRILFSALLANFDQDIKQHIMLPGDSKVLKFINYSKNQFVIPISYVNSQKTLLSIFSTKLIVIKHKFSGNAPFLCILSADSLPLLPITEWELIFEGSLPKDNVFYIIEFECQFELTTKPSIGLIPNQPIVIIQYK